MIDKQENTHKPTISPGRLDTTPADTFVRNTKEDRRAYAFMKDKEPIQALSVRLPSSMHQELRKLAFKTEKSLNQIIVKAIREYLKRNKQQIKL